MSEDILIEDFNPKSLDDLKNMSTVEIAKELIEEAEPEELFECLQKENKLAKTPEGQIALKKFKDYMEEPENFYKKSPSRSPSKSRGRSPSKSRGRSPSKSRGRSPSKSRGRSRSKSRGRSPKKSPSRSKSRSKSRSQKDAKSPTIKTWKELMDNLGLKGIKSLGDDTTKRMTELIKMMKENNIKNIPSKDEIKDYAKKMRKKSSKFGTNMYLQNAKFGEPSIYPHI